jgi:hypothetical protein
MTRQSQRRTIRRFAEAFVRAKARFATLVESDETPDASSEECRAACERMLRTRARLVAAVLDAVGCGLDEGPAVVDLGRLIVAVGEGPDNEGIREQVCDPSVIVVDKARIVRLGCGGVQA